MFANYVYEKSSAQYHDKILLIDVDSLEITTKFSNEFTAHGFEVIIYEDDLSFRLSYEAQVKSSEQKTVVIAKAGAYVPYDILSKFTCYRLSLADLFPQLNSQVIKERTVSELGLICCAYKNVYDDLRKRNQTEQFINQYVYSKANAEIYLRYCIKRLNNLLERADLYSDWFEIAKAKADIDVLISQYNIDVDTSHVNSYFKNFILSNFGKLSQNLDESSPVLVSKAMEFMTDHSKKFIVIVMDGMSMFDWKIISQSFNEIKYNESTVFAMIPTTTSISRQCLLSNKYPSQLLAPWNQGKEKQEFTNCANELGFNNSQIHYQRGYAVDIDSVVRCGAIIINDIDDLVHAQQQGQSGMFNDISLLKSNGALVHTVKNLLSLGFDVYITSDHGNTPCIGMGKYMGAGVEIETKSRRMMVLKDFADKTTLIDRYNMIDYPKYYLTKEYDYLICDTGTSLDSKGEKVISHGGITIDEVIVPFIKIKSEDYNG